MITKEDALTENEFHSGCEASVGPRGGIHFSPCIVRRNGRTRTWQRQPERFEVPYKYGLYAYGYITEDDVDHYYTRQNCPVCGAMREHHHDPDAMRSSLATIEAEKILGITTK